MHSRCLGWLVVASLLVGASGTAVQAASPLSKLALFKHLEADPHELYPISDQNGPWMIMVATFSGEGAENQARDLIYELRKDYKLPAYSYQKKFDYSKPVRGKGMTPQGEAPMMKYRKNTDLTEIAVLVGDYAAVDDPEAQKYLKKLKYAHPKSLEVEANKTKQALAGYRKLQSEALQVLNPKDKNLSARGPMANAFVITNPILPSNYFVPKGLDKLVISMNKDATHGLLDCREPYTVKVATFTGHAIILDQKNLDAIERGETPKSYLEEAAKNAHLMTEALRKHGYEAYEFHDRNSSIVTVGAFHNVGTKRADGKIEINPAVHTLMQTFGAPAKVEPGKAPRVGKARKLSDIIGKQQIGKKLPDIPFDVQPLPVEVPRATISSAYDRTAQRR